MLLLCTFSGLGVAPEAALRGLCARDFIEGTLHTTRRVRPSIVTWTGRVVLTADVPTGTRMIRSAPMQIRAVLAEARFQRSP